VDAIVVGPALADGRRRTGVRPTSSGPACEDGASPTEDRMSELEHPSHDDKDENISLVRSTLGFAATAVVSLVGMFLILIWNHQGGF
jgi:hypothetical protein